MNRKEKERCNCRPDGRLCEDACNYGCRKCVSRNAAPTNDLGKLRDYLSSRYDSTSLMLEVRSLYDPPYMMLYGMKGAMTSYLVHIRDNLHLSIPYEDIRKIAEEIVARGDITY